MYTPSGYSYSNGGIVTSIPLGNLSTFADAVEEAAELTALYGKPCGVVLMAPNVTTPAGGTLAYLGISVPGVADGIAAPAINAGYLKSLQVGAGKWELQGNQPIWVLDPVAPAQPPAFPGVAPAGVAFPGFGGPAIQPVNAGLFARLDSYLRAQGF